MGVELQTRVTPLQSTLWGHGQHNARVPCHTREYSILLLSFGKQQCPGFLRLGAASVGALVHGLRTYDPEVRVAGVILNQLGGEGHYHYLIPALSTRVHNPSEACPPAGGARVLRRACSRRCWRKNAV